MSQKNDEVFAIQTVVRTIRKQKVILDSDLALIYGVATKALNQAVKRNLDRFTVDFMFRLTSEELAELQRSRSQFVTLNRGHNIKYSALVDLYEQIRPLLMPPPESPRPKVGFGVREKRTAYRAGKRF